MLEVVAYFSMEIALDSNIPTYSGGLGVLAGDTVRTAADMKIPFVGVSLLHRKGYFFQSFDPSGWQKEEPQVWNPAGFMTELKERVTLTLEKRKVKIRAWRYDVTGSAGFKVPVFFLDTSLEENSPEDRALTDYLYGGGGKYRLCQEVVLGIGGVRMLRQLGYRKVRKFHMNEGHASLLGIELLGEQMQQKGKTKIDDTDVEAVKSMCVFTTHTPVPAGHDKFPIGLVREVLGYLKPFEHKDVFGNGDELNMTYLALNLSGHINGVAKKHTEVSRRMFSGYMIDAITNGVHAATWVSEPFQKLYDRYIPEWRNDNSSLRYALSIPREEIWQAHLVAKRKLLDLVNRDGSIHLHSEYLTIGFARRATTYKRADLLFYDVGKLEQIARERGPIQFVFAGKAHPKDDPGKHVIRKIYEMREQLKNHVQIAYLENYDMSLGGLITAGVDVWLNTPQPPLEASGTSGMKAALNGVPSLSILDGWWIEGYIAGVTGWAIGDGTVRDDASKSDAESLYEQIGEQVVPAFYTDHDRFLSMMINSIALNGSFFNTQRMMQEYVTKTYYR